MSCVVLSCQDMVAGEGTRNVEPQEVGPWRSQFSLGSAPTQSRPCHSSEPTPPWALRLSLGHRASCMALPASWPIFHGSHPSIIPCTGRGCRKLHPEAGGREAVCLCTFLGLFKGRLSLAWHSSPGGSPCLLPKETWPLPQLTPEPLDRPQPLQHQITPIPV